WRCPACASCPFSGVRLRSESHIRALEDLETLPPEYSKERRARPFLPNAGASRCVGRDERFLATGSTMHRDLQFVPCDPGSADLPPIPACRGHRESRARIFPERRDE